MPSSHNITIRSRSWYLYAYELEDMQYASSRGSNSPLSGALACIFSVGLAIRLSFAVIRAKSSILTDAHPSSIYSTPYTKRVRRGILISWTVALWTCMTFVFCLPDGHNAPPCGPIMLFCVWRKRKLRSGSSSNVSMGLVVILCAATTDGVLVKTGLYL